MVIMLHKLVIILDTMVITLHDVFITLTFRETGFQTPPFQSGCYILSEELRHPSLSTSDKQCQYELQNHHQHPHPQN